MSEQEKGFMKALFLEAFQTNKEKEDQKLPTELNYSHCPECLKDRIYALEDGDGVCIDCHAIVKGPVIGSISAFEYNRLRGEVVEEMTRAIVGMHAAATADAMIKQEVSEKVKVVSPATKMVVPPKGPGFFSKIGSFVKGVAKTVGEAFGEAKKGFKEHAGDKAPTDKAEAVKAPAVPTNPLAKAAAVIAGIPVAPKRPTPPVQAAPATPAITCPIVGERWTVGPCIACFGKNSKAYTGYIVSEATYIRNVGNPLKKKFAYLECYDGAYRFGCGLCAKKA